MSKSNFLLILDKYGNQHIEEYLDDFDEMLIGEDSSHYQSLYMLDREMKVLENLDEKLSEYFIKEYRDNPVIFENPPPFVRDSEAFQSLHK